MLLLGETGYFSFMSEKHTAGAGSPLVDGGNEVSHITLETCTAIIRLIKFTMGILTVIEGTIESNMAGNRG